MLTSKQQERLELAKATFDKPVLIITPAEATEKEKKKSSKKKTWHFKAENVRDFAFASSRKFIWDAQAVKLPTNTTMAMSFYPKERGPYNYDSDGLDTNGVQRSAGVDSIGNL